MALGSRNGRTFHPGQATELITFLARVVDFLGACRRLIGIHFRQHFGRHKV